MRRALVVAASMIFGVSALAAGCGAAGGAQSASATGAGSVCANGAASPQGHDLALTAADDGKTYCVHKGAGVLVTLRGTPASPWAPIQAGSSVLAPKANGRMILMVGATGAYFVAAHPGTAKITSHRGPCKVHPVSSPSASATIGGSAAAMCGAEQVFRVTVVVAR